MTATNKSTPGKRIKAIAAQRRKREAELLIELQKDHGYMLSKAKGRQVETVFSKSGKTLKVTPVRLITLAVPVDSALGLALADGKVAP